jgi:hypothetical protein
VCAQLLKNLEFDEDSDLVVLAGDVVNKGPKSVETVQKVRGRAQPPRARSHARAAPSGTSLLSSGTGRGVLTAIYTKAS